MSPAGPWRIYTSISAAAPTQALIAPIVTARAGAGRLSCRRPQSASHANADYRGFVELLAAQVSAALARADDFERARARPRRWPRSTGPRPRSFPTSATNSARR